jgi:hypothetical protein
MHIIKKSWNIIFHNLQEINVMFLSNFITKSTKVLNNWTLEQRQMAVN